MIFNEKDIAAYHIVGSSSRSFLRILGLYPIILKKFSIFLTLHFTVTTVTNNNKTRVKSKTSKGFIDVTTPP